MPCQVEYEAARRRTFAIISHPDAGKTTLTEKLLLFGGAIQMAGSVKGRKAARHATSDWMALEKERGISVTSSVMQFPYEGRIVNLLDTPGHADFGEDTYRVLTAVDSALMVIDVAKGVEERTIKLMEVCRMRDTPIMTFINKLDREGREPIELLDEVESVLGIQCAPVTWPIGMGSRLMGVVHLATGEVHLYEAGRNFTRQDSTIFASIDDPGVGRRSARTCWPSCATRWSWCRAPRLRSTRRIPRRRADAGVLRFGGEQFRRAAAAGFLRRARAAARNRTRPRPGGPGGSAADGIRVQDPGEHGPAAPRPRRVHAHLLGQVQRRDEGLPPAHRQGSEAGQRADLHGQRPRDRRKRLPGDVIGIHNHGTISIGDTFTEGENLAFTGIPNFAPELFRRARLRDPLKLKQLQKGWRSFPRKARPSSSAR